MLNAWEKRRELLAPGTRPAGPEIDVAAELEELAAALLPELAEVAAAVRALAVTRRRSKPRSLLEERAIELLRESLGSCRAGGPSPGGRPGALGDLK